MIFLECKFLIELPKKDKIFQTLFLGCCLNRQILDFQQEKASGQSKTIKVVN